MMRRLIINAYDPCIERFAIRYQRAWLIVLVIGDMLAVSVAQLVCFQIRYSTTLFPSAIPSRHSYALFLGLTLGVVALAMAMAGAYRLPRRFRLFTCSATVLRAMVLHIVSITLAIYLLRLGTVHAKNPFLYSRFVVTAGWMLMFFLLLAWRTGVGRLQRAFFGRGWGVRRTIVLGAGSEAQHLATALRKQQWRGNQVLGLVGAGEEESFPLLGQVKEFRDIVARLNVDVVWLTEEAAHCSRILELIFQTPRNTLRWAMGRRDFQRLLQAMAGEPPMTQELARISHQPSTTMADMALPASLRSIGRPRRIAEDTPSAGLGRKPCGQCHLSHFMTKAGEKSGFAPSGESLPVQLTKRVEHNQDPLAGPKITFIGSRGIPATYGGVERYVEELGSRLVSSGYQVSVYCRRHYTSLQGNFRGVELRYVPCARTKHLEAITHTILATARVLFTDDEIVHYQALGPSLLAWFPRLLGRKTIVTVQGLDWQRKKWGPIAQAVLRLGEWASACLPHRTIVVSHALERHYRDRHGATVIHIPNGVNSMPSVAADRIHTLGLRKNSYVLAVGRLVPEKGHDTLIGAFHRVETDKQLVIVGGGSHSDAYVAKLHEMAKGIRVIFTGYQYGRMLEELFSNAYLYVSASLVEGLPISLLEAMSIGTNSLVSDIPPHLEMVGGVAHTFRAGDEEDLVERLQALLKEPHFSADEGDELRRRALARYSWDRVADLTERVYQDLTEQIEA